jgi:hypothetical protein
MKRAAACAVLLVVFLAPIACRPSASSAPAEVGISDAQASSTPSSSTPNPLAVPTAAAAAIASPARHPPMPSYFTSYASHTRSSRVSVPSRPLAALKRVAPIDGPPRFVLVNAAGDHVVLDYNDRFEVRSAAGASLARGPKNPDTPILVFASSFIADDDERDFAGRPGVVALMTRVSHGDAAWAIEVGDQTAAYVVQKQQHPFPTTQALPDGSGAANVWSTAPVQLTVESVQFYSAERSNSMRLWIMEHAGTGCGAIGNDRFIAVAMADQRFFGYDAGSPAVQGKTVPIATAHLGFVPRDISIVDGGIAALSGTGNESTVHLLDRHGIEQWQAVVPFAVDTPPIDAGQGRVFLVGAGFAAAEAGKTLWAHPSKNHVFATSLSDGSVLVAAGPELHLTKRDGTIVQSLHVPEGDDIKAPPAVAADGSVWLATAKGLYVAH